MTGRSIFIYSSLYRYEFRFRLDMYSSCVSCLHMATNISVRDIHSPDQEISPTLKIERADFSNS